MIDSIPFSPSNSLNFLLPLKCSRESMKVKLNNLLKYCLFSSSSSFKHLLITFLLCSNGNIVYLELISSDKISPKVLFKRLDSKYPDFKFQYFASSDWECSYIWAYDPIKCAFAYLSTSAKIFHQVVNLRKEFFTIDTNYGYLELPIMGQASQLIIYEKHFLYKLFSDLYKSINAHITSAFDNKLFYDSYNNILYLSNGVNSMQSILIDRIEEVFYTDTRIQFSLPNNSKIINFLADKEFINEFEEFVVGYNLRKIANSFDYKSDKLINVNTHTKFIVDKTRDRFVYCANLNKFYSFSYLTIAFSNLLSADVHRNASVCYVRIKTKDNETFDVTCQKREVAYYVKAQIDSIVSGRLS